MKRQIVIAFVCLMVVLMLGVWAVNGVLADNNIDKSILYTSELAESEPFAFSQDLVNISPIPIPGDANHDYIVNVGDIVKTERMILGYDELYIGADANLNGVIDMGDVIKIERYIYCINYIPGDSDGDGQITNNDITTTEKIILGIKQNLYNADANRDSNIDMGDIAYLERMLLRDSY